MRKKGTIQVFCLVIIFIIELITLLLWDDQDKMQKSYNKTINKSNITNEQKKIWDSLDSETKKELYERFKNYYK